jgi:hypothetical protein
MADEWLGASSWRGGKRDSTRRPSKPTYRWLGLDRKPNTAAKPPHGGILGTAGPVLAFVACLGLVIWLILMLIRPAQVAVVLVGADYATNLAVPQNVLGWEGLAAIEKVVKARRRWALFQPASLHLIPNHGNKTLAGKHQWDELIAELKKGFRENTLLLVVTLHGGTKGGRAYLMPDLMASPEDGLDLEAVIESLGELEPIKHKILVLDGAIVPADWRLGMLHNDFAGALRRLEPKIRKVPNLWVLSSCSVDQRSWASEELGSTAFLHYVCSALRGEADRSGRQLTLGTLYNFVRARVRKWAWNARGALQEPMLLPDPKAEGGSDKTEGRDPAKVLLAAAQRAPAPQPPPPPDEEKLRKAWARFSALDTAVPHPAIYAPQHWREYRATLVRYEELARGGGTDPGSPAERIADRLSELDSQLQEARFLKKLATSLQTSFVSSAIAGGMVEPAGSYPREFVNFVAATRPGEAEKVYSELEASAASGPGDLRRPPRSRLGEYLLAYAADAPLHQKLPRAAQLLTTLQGSEEILPAEAHFLRMLSSMVPPLKERPVLEGLVRKALILRGHAERAALGVAASPRPRAAAPTEYHYVEQLHPWIKDKVAAADLARRQGEDQLFSYSEQDWAGAGRDLARASQLYDEASDRASRVRFALAVRDRLLAALPDYSRWLAHRRPGELQDDLPALLSRLWRKAHELDQLLALPSTSAELGSLDAGAQTLDKEFKQLHDQFIQQATAEKGRVGEDWEAADAADAVAFSEGPELDSRSRIWDRLDNIRKRDQEVAATVAAGSAADPGPDESKRVIDQARRRASVQGAMALAALGESWFKDPAQSEQQQANYEKTLDLLQHLADGDRADTWHQEAARTGDHIGARWRALAGQIKVLTSEENGIGDSREFETNLTQADRMARALIAAPEQTAEPAGRLREKRVHDLLIWLAQRAWLDHWHDENPQAKEPYYRSLGTSYLADAAKLFPELDKSREEARALIAAKGDLKLEGPVSAVLTSERVAPLSFRVVDAGKVPPGGIPVVRSRPDPSLEMVAGAREYQGAPRTESPERVEFRIGSPLIREFERFQDGHDPRYAKPQPRTAPFRVEGFFRGQRFSMTTEVALHPVPDLVALGRATPEPPLASIAVRANPEIIDRFGQGTGSLAIVLDWSGSMDEAVPGAPAKFQQAKDALASVLKQVPEGTRLSLWIFSQIPKDQPVPHRDDPINLRPQLTITQLREPAGWNAKQAQALIEKLDRFRPFLHTPLVAAMWKAAETDLKSAKGLKTLLVLTDGQDDRFSSDEELNPTRMDIPTFIGARFANLGIRVNMVFFAQSPNPDELKVELGEARATFTPALAKLEPPGRFFEARNLPELISSLRRAVGQKLACQIEKPDGSSVSEEPLEVTNPAKRESDRWYAEGLNPARYKLRVVTDRTDQAEINLESGDRLIVRLAPEQGDKIAFERALYGEDFQDAEFMEKPDWRLTVLAHCQLRRNALDRLALLAALEARSKLNPIGQLNPQLVWFELGGAGIEHANAQIALRYRERVGYPAPVWELDVPQWPAQAGAAPAGPAQAVLKAWWWDPNKTLPEAAVEKVNLDQGPGPQDVFLKDGKTLVIEFVGLEPGHFVEAQPGEPPRPEPFCLVVRLAYPKDEPYCVDPEPLRQLMGPRYEHRFYSQAGNGKYTGLFWPINPSQRERIKSLQLISLRRLRQIAEKNQTSVSITLPKPRGESKPPDPPQAIRP